MKSDSSGTPDRHPGDCSDSTRPGEDKESLEGSASAEALASGGLDGREDAITADTEIVSECLDPEVQSRLWLKAIVPLLQLRSHETDPSGRVQFAFDLMYIAACERIARILRSDTSPSQE
jgi:hypothetical protein